MNRPRSALIVGASGQLGSALTKELAKLGCDLWLASTSADALEALAAGVRERHNVRADVQTVDISDAESVRRLYDEVAADHDHTVDWVVVNAGRGSTRPPGEPMEHAEGAAELVAVNVGGVINVLRGAIGLLENSGHGRIIVISSLSVFVGNPDSPIYSGSKAAARIVSVSLKPALTRRGISLTMAYPGFLTKSSSRGGSAHRPFAMTPEFAAERIVRAGLRNRAQVLFPWQMALFVRVMSALPTVLRDRVFLMLSKETPGG